jgi:NADPH:quinone reductase-like Zn-dependent oxidoreductase
VPVPEPGRGQVRIRVEATAGIPSTLPPAKGSWADREHVGVGIGWDVASSVDTVGPEVSGFAGEGKAVGLRDRLDQSLGTYAEQVVPDAADVASAPAKIGSAAAASQGTSAVLSFEAAWTGELHTYGYESGFYSSGGSGVTDLAGHYTTDPMPDVIWDACCADRVQAQDPFRYLIYADMRPAPKSARRPRRRGNGLQPD